MSSSGKKGKKKGTVISLQSFLSNGDAPVGTTQVAKKIRNFDAEDSDDGTTALPLVYQLPTAPRASRIFDDGAIPHKPPYIAYLTNLPFDISEDDIYEYLNSYTILSVRLPREDSESGRVRGFGYVELETRDDLIQVLSLPDPSIKGRRVRIDLSNETEQHNKGSKGSRRGFDNSGHYAESKESNNWRRDNNDSNNLSNNFDRSFKDKKLNADINNPGSWRAGNRSNIPDVSPKRQSSKALSLMEESVQERPKLNLKPRTLPLPEIVAQPDAEFELKPSNKSENFIKPCGVSSEKVFGSAKPVDTTARDMEIEERLAEYRKKEILQHDADVCEKIKELKLEKLDKENSNSETNWRHKGDTNRNVDNKDNRREYRESNNYNKGNGKIERSEMKKGTKVAKNQARDGKQKDESRNKRELKTDRPLPKHALNQSGPILQSSNMYSGLDEETSE
ncbi:eukaryotic translation initiation factor 4B isoform 2-T2 [Glossina fuscipes fuscipes]